MKDKGGHGSESRGGSAKVATDATRRTFTQKYGATGGTMASRGGAAAEARFHESATQISANHPGWGGELKLATAGGQPVASDAHAAATLASGPKSAPVDVHPAQVGQMKMSQEHFASLSAAVAPHLASTADSSHSAMRQRWDAMNKSGYDTRPLYKAGLNDNHIDTALRKIQGK